jgi:serine protease Do
MWSSAKCFVVVLLFALVQPASAASELSEQSRAFERAVNAVVGVQSLAVPDARSNATLGRIRQGSGVVIDPAGLVLTIGYLVLEADQVQLQLDDGRSLPARVAGYDIATGFGLLQSLAPLSITPAPLGKSEAVAPSDSLLIVSGAPMGELSAARLVSRRTFAGYWEYRIDGALFTAPPRTDHSGAGLFNANGELVGIGSLVVADVGGSPEIDAPRMPGNMFVPIDLLRPILAELRRGASTAASKRAWLGINCVEHGGKLHVVRVNDDSPAESAGLQVGDRVVSIDGVVVSSLDALWTLLWRGDAERDVQLEIERDDTRQSLTVRTVDRQRQLRRATGV